MQILTKLTYRNLILIIMLLLGSSSLTLSCSGNNKKLSDVNCEGVYQNISGSSVKLKLIRIQDSVYYFEFYNEVKDSVDQRLFGIYFYRQNHLELHSVSEPLNVLNLTGSGTDTFFVDQSSLKIFDSFSNISGAYVRVHNMTVINPDFSDFITDKWDEGVAIVAKNASLCNFPFEIGSKVALNLNRGDTVRSYIDSYKNTIPDFDFVYIEYKVKSQKIIGWMSAQEYYSAVKHVYKCQKNDDGTVEKWNKEGGYTLYLDKSGKVVKKVKD